MKNRKYRVLFVSIILGLAKSFLAPRRTSQYSVGGVATKDTIPSTTKPESSLAASLSEDQKFRTTSKEPKKVIIDPKTGLYRPIKQSNNKESSGGLSWDGFKTIVYNGVDVLTTQVPQTVQKIKEMISDQDEISSAPVEQPTPSSPARSMTLSQLSSSSVEARNQIVGSYKEREEEFMKNLKDPPGKRLMKEFKVAPNGVNGKAYRGVDDVLVKPNAFESIKSAVYTGLDAVSSTTGSQTSDANGAAAASSQPSAPLKRLPSSLQTREVQARLLASDEEFLQAMEELQSENPLTRLAAGYKVRRMIEKDEILKKEREKAARREERILAIKSGIYAAGDSIAGGAQVLVELPGKMSKTYEKTVVGTKQTIEAAQALPEQVKGQVKTVKQKVAEAKQSVQDGVETTKDIIENTKQLPTKVQRTVQETGNSVQRTAEQTKRVLDGIGKSTQEVTTRSKVLLGLEKPKPKPPMAEPSKEMVENDFSISRLVMKSLSVTGSLAGKVTWIVGKETTKLAWKGTKLAVTKGLEAMEEATAKEQERRELAKEAFAAGNPPLEAATKDQKKKKKVDRDQTTEEVAADTTDLAKKDKDKTAASDKDKKEPQQLQQQQQQQQEVAEDQIVPDLTQRKEEIELSVLDLEQEIAEALRLADEAIESAQIELEEEEKKGSSGDKKKS